MMVHPVRDMLDREFEAGDRIKVVFKSIDRPKSEWDKVSGYFHYLEEHYFVIFTDRAEVYNEDIKGYEYQLQGDRILVPHDNVLFITGPIEL